MNRKENKRIMTAVACICIFIGVCMGVWGFYVQTNYDKVEATITVHRGYKNRKVAYVEYDYDNNHYSNIGLSSYNGFTMKTGKPYTVYVNSQKPDKPSVVSYAFPVFFIGFGVFAVVCVNKKSRYDI